MAIEIAFTKSGCQIVATELDGEVLVMPKENVSFQTLGQVIKLRLGTDSDNRRYTLAPSEISISAVVPANAAAFITAMGVLLQCTATATGGVVIPTEQGWYGAWTGTVGVAPELVAGTATLSLARLISAKVHFIIIDNVLSTLDAGDYTFNTATGIITMPRNWIADEVVTIPYYIIPTAA